MSMSMYTDMIPDMKLNSSKNPAIIRDEGDEFLQSRDSLMKKLSGMKRYPIPIDIDININAAVRLLILSPDSLYSTTEGVVRSKHAFTVNNFGIKLCFNSRSMSLNLLNH